MSSPVRAGGIVDPEIIAPQEAVEAQQGSTDVAEAGRHAYAQKFRSSASAFGSELSAAARTLATPKPVGCVIVGIGGALMLIVTLCALMTAVMPWWWVEELQADGSRSEREYLGLWDRLDIEKDGKNRRALQTACVLSLVEFVAALVAAAFLISASYWRSPRLASWGSWASGTCMCASLGTLVEASLTHQKGEYNHSASGAYAEIVGMVFSLLTWFLLGKRHTSTVPQDEVYKRGRGLSQISLSPRSVMAR